MPLWPDCSNTLAERHFLRFSGRRQRSRSYLMSSPNRAISEETAQSSTRKKKINLLSALSKTSWVLLCGHVIALSFCLWHTHTHTQSCAEHGLGSGDVDCPPPQGFRGMKFGVMAVSTIRVMLMVYDPQWLSTQTPKRTHTDTPRWKILLHNTYVFTDMLMCSHMQLYEDASFEVLRSFAAHIFPHVMANPQNANYVETWLVELQCHRAI